MSTYTYPYLHPISPTGYPLPGYTLTFYTPIDYCKKIIEKLVFKRSELLKSPIVLHEIKSPFWTPADPSLEY